MSSINYEPQTYIDRTFNDYYKDVGKYSVLDAKTERRLIIRYKTCPHCNKKIPQKIRRGYCPDCGEVIPKKVRSRIYNCPTCKTKCDVYIVPTYCSYCGSDRDYAARDKLITSNLRFVVKTAKTFTKNRERLLFLVSAGNIGLMTALDKFDLRLQTRFLTYAAWWVRKEMMDEINSSSLVHIPSHKQKEQRKVSKQRLYICRHCDFETDSARDKEEHPSCIRDVHDFVLVEIDDQISTIYPIDTIPIPSSEDIEDTAISGNTAKVLREILQKLDLRQRDQFIVLQYFNIPSRERRASAKSLHQLAEIAGITPERVRQIKERTLKDLRLELKRRAITSLDDLCY